MPNKNIFNLDEEQLKTSVTGEYFAEEDQYYPVATDKAGNLMVSSEMGQFDEIISAEKVPLIELKGVYGLTVLRDTTVTNNASITNAGDEYQLSTQATNPSSATLDTTERGRYLPGLTGEAGVAVRLPSAPTGTQEAKWGYFDDQNGAYFGQDSTGIFVAIRRNGSETFRVYQSNWNADSLDGTGPSGLTLDTSKGNIYHILYTCYGYGVTNFRIAVADSNNVQQIVTVHRFKPASDTTFEDPNLYVRAQVTNGDTTAEALDLFVAGRQYSVYGRYKPERRITSERKTSISIDGTISPTVSFRRKTDFPAAGRPNSVSVKLEGIDIISDADAIIEIRYDPSLTDAAWGTPTNTSSSETAVESDTSATDLTGGELIFSGLVGGGSVFSTSFITANLLELDFNGTQPVTVAIKTISGSGTANVVFRIREEW